MKILFIGGTGVISSACSALAIECGFELFLMNRGQSSREVPEGAKILKGEIPEPASVEAALLQTYPGPEIHFATASAQISRLCRNPAIP